MQDADRYDIGPRRKLSYFFHEFDLMTDVEKGERLIKKQIPARRIRS